MSTSAVAQTQLIRISARGSSPEQAAGIANTMADVVIARNRAGNFGTRGSLSIAERAVPPGQPAGAGLAVSVLLGVLGGSFLAAAGIGLREYTDDRVRDPERLQALGVPFLGSIRRVKGRRPGLVSRDQPDSSDAEAYRVIRTAVQFAFLDRPLPSLFVTSAQPGEGKTTTAANLAVVAAQAGKRVVLMDADLRRPQIHRVFGLSNRRGLTDLMLQSNGHFSEFLQESGVPGCWVLTSGPLPPNPDAVMSSARLHQILYQMARAVDLLVIDGPPVLPVADAGCLAHVAGGAVLVVNARRTRRPSVLRALAALQHAGGTVVGSVLNQVPGRDLGAYYGYGYTYGSSSPVAPPPPGRPVEAASSASPRDAAA